MTYKEVSQFIRAVSGFHDGFIKQISIYSDDWFDWRSPNDVGHIITGNLHAEIHFAQHPTLLKGTTWPAVQRYIFRQVEDVMLDFRGIHGERWPLFDVRIQKYGQGRMRLECSWEQGAYRQLFTFATMET